MDLLSPIKDHHSERRLFIARIFLSSFIAILLLGTVIARLVQLQVIDHEYFAERSQGNRVRIEPVPPIRGLILDRKGRVLAENFPIDGDTSFIPDDELPYHNIIGLNEHAAVLHYQHRDRRPPEEIRSFLIDAGASAAGYAADITRTYAATEGDFAALIDDMHRLQQAIVAEVRAGVDFRELHLETHRRLGGVLLAHDIASAGSAEALVEAGVTRAFMPHGLGHLLGLQVHDVGGFMADDEGGTIPAPEHHPHLRLTRTLATDQVLTIEPGLYFIDLLLESLRSSPAGRLVNWLRVEQLQPCGGIRIEDNVRVLADGTENLTRDAFAALAVV